MSNTRPKDHPQYSDLKCPFCGAFLDKPWGMGGHQEWSCQNPHCDFDMPAEICFRVEAFLKMADSYEKTFCLKMLKEIIR